MAKNLGIKRPTGNKPEMSTPPSLRQVNDFIGNDEPENEFITETPKKPAPVKPEKKVAKKKEISEERSIKRYTFEIFEDQHKQLKIMAAEEGKSMVSFVRDWFDKQLPSK